VRFKIALIGWLCLVVPRVATPQVSHAPAEQVSIIQLIANPSKYDGHRVDLQAFLSVEFEGTAAYLSKDDYDHLITKNAVWIAFDKKSLPQAQSLSQQYVFITATFYAKQFGHLSLFSGELRDVERVNACLDRAKMPQPKQPGT
jgi:hypothetical protein